MLVLKEVVSEVVQEEFCMHWYNIDLQQHIIVILVERRFQLPSGVSGSGTDTTFGVSSSLNMQIIFKQQQCWLMHRIFNSNRWWRW